MAKLKLKEMADYDTWRHYDEFPEDITRQPDLKEYSRNDILVSVRRALAKREPLVAEKKPGQSTLFYQSLFADELEALLEGARRYLTCDVSEGVEGPISPEHRKIEPEL